LLNTSRLDLGYTQEGEEIDDVLLPRWAEDMQDFMFYMRAALESDLASVNLHKWIDIIWGYKQIGPEAEKAENLYYHLCYEKNIDWNVYKNPFHKRAIDIQISEYGQIPIQLFDHPHPKKRIKIPASMANQGYFLFI
jgi:factor associated with neutral sphingomyelinase activation